MIQDFSNWDQSLFDYGKQLISYKDIFQFDQNDAVSFSPDHIQKQKDLFNNVVEAHLFWIGFGVGVENITKAVLIKHQILKITRRKDFDNNLSKTMGSVNSSLQPQVNRKHIDIDKYQAVYQAVYNTEIASKNNLWLKNQFIKANIVHPFEINTPTLNELYSSQVSKLIEKGIIINEENVMIGKSLEVLKLMRRNVDCHVFLKNRTIGSINKDIELVYLPVINLLTNIYHRKMPGKFKLNV